MLVDVGLDNSLDAIFHMDNVGTAKPGRKWHVIRGGRSGQKKLAPREELVSIVTLISNKAEEAGHPIPLPSP